MYTAMLSPVLGLFVSFFVCSVLFSVSCVGVVGAPGFCDGFSGSLGVVALFDSILDGGGTNKDNQDDLISSVRTSSLEAYLKQFSHTGDAPQSSDGMFYKMYGDGVGWPTIGNSDLQWKSHQDSFACQGKVFDGEEEKTVENVKDYVNGFLTRGSNATYTNEEVSAQNYTLLLLKHITAVEIIQLSLYN